jgi:eukaryotic-like serine/threonine-protein kinase
MKIKGSDDLPDLTPDEDRLLELLVAYEQALADGTLSPEAPETLVDLTAQQLDQLARGKHLLDLLALLSQDSQKGSVSIPPTSPAVEASPAGASELDWLNVLADGAPPQRQLGRFLIVRELGVGAHGVVLLAFDPVLKRHVALKVPRGEALVSTSLRQRFLREARATARLTHPNLASVYEVGEAGALCYIASAFCAGPNVATWLQSRRRPLAPEQAAHPVAQLAAAMHYAHSQGVLHRDIKPSNILLEPLRDHTSVAGPTSATRPSACSGDM